MISNLRNFVLLVMKIFFLFFILASLFPTPIFPQANSNYVRLHLKNETYQNGRLLLLEADYFFDKETGNLVVKGAVPEEHIKISNRLGEVKVYYPQKNQVIIKQSQYFSSENELVYYFLSNNYYDLGLKNQGFTVSETRMDGNYQVVTWTAPANLTTVEKIELVFDNETPIYAADFNPQGKIVRKIYYYDYNIYSTFMFPSKVTQISYTPNGDSIIQRNTWTQLKTSALPNSDYFNFKIPEDAVVINK